MLIGLAIGFALLAVFFRPAGRSGSHARATAEGPTDLPARRTALMHQLADLDDRYEKGRLPEEEYRARRNAFKAELVEMTRVLDGKE